MIGSPPAPPGYVERVQLVVTEGRRLLWLNLLALVPLALALVWMSAWWSVVLRWRGERPGEPFPWALGLLVVLLVMPLHEAVHALAIALLGYRPRFGAKLDKGVLYVTADGALFPRAHFVAIALAPLAVLTLAGMALVAALPDPAGYWAGMATVYNAGSSIGDLWMAREALRYPADSLVRDEADGIRVYVRADG